MHPVFMSDMVEHRQCDLWVEAQAAGGPAHLKGTGKGRLRRVLGRRRRQRDPSTIQPGC